MTAAPTIVFDLDGTLIDSRDAMVAAFAAAFRRTVGAGPAPVGEFLALQGKRFDEILAALGLPVAMWEPFIEESRLRVNSVPVIPGVQALLERLVAGGYQLALLTGKDRGRTDELLAALGLSAFFSAVVTSTDGLPTKPAPDAVWAILELLGCDPRRACMVGDAPADIEAATAAGIYAIGVGWGIGSAAALSQAGAIAVLTSPDDLDPCLEDCAFGWRSTRVGRLGTPTGGG